MAKKFPKIDISAFEDRLNDELFMNSVNLVDYVRQNEPIDMSPDKDDIVLRERTTVELDKSHNTKTVTVTYGTDYAEMRNKENNLNPQYLGFIEKTEENGLDILLGGIDIDDLVRLK